MSTQEKHLVKITGKVIWLDFEGGFWGIEGDDGKKYRPQNLSKEAQQDGQRITAELEIIPTVNSIGAAFVCWSPLGAGFLTGTVKNLDETDFRNNIARPAAEPR